MFSSKLGCYHRKITPYWPRTNAEAERFMRTMKKIIKTAEVENKSWKQELYRLLRNYRATPHCTTGVAPASLLFSRPIRTKLPNFQESTSDDELRTRDGVQKSIMNNYADNKSYVQQSTITTGDNSLGQAGTCSVETTDSVRKGSIGRDQKKGSMVTAKRRGHRITRNASFFKKSMLTLNRIPYTMQLAMTSPTPRPLESARRTYRTLTLITRWMPGPVTFLTKRTVRN